jgi:hypothetical protein
MKSFYVVELASTGGMYRDSQFTYGTLTETQQALDYELVTDVRARGYTFAYDAVPLRTYIQGRKKQEINLFPFMTIRGANGIAFTLREKGPRRNLTKAHGRGVRDRAELVVVQRRRGAGAGRVDAQDRGLFRDAGTSRRAGGGRVQ